MFAENLPLTHFTVDLDLAVVCLYVCVLTGMWIDACGWASPLLLESSVSVSRASLTRMDTARRMKEANRFMWMLFLMQWSFLVQRWQSVKAFGFPCLFSRFHITLFLWSSVAFHICTLFVSVHYIFTNVHLLAGLFLARIHKTDWTDFGDHHNQ